jgi:receptor expression-enhancing protein 5/6
MVGFVYPALKSFQAIEHRSTTSSSSSTDVTQWLIYWVVYSFFSIIEVFIDILLYWIPFYYAFKIAFLLWAMLPQTRGAKFLYDSFLKDFLKSKESMMDRALRDAKKTTSTTTKVQVVAADANAAASSSSSSGANNVENVKKDE